MAEAAALRELLATEFGITSDAELVAALKRMRKINIGPMARPKARKEERSGGKTLQESA